MSDVFERHIGPEPDRVVAHASPTEFKSRRLTAEIADEGADLIRWTTAHPCTEIDFASCQGQ